MSTDKTSRICFSQKLDALIACLPPAPFKEALLDEIGECLQASRKQALEDVAVLATVGATYPELMEYIQMELLK